MKLNRFDARPVCPHHHCFLRKRKMDNGREYLRCPRKSCFRVAAIVSEAEEHSAKSYFNARFLESEA